MGTDIGQNTAVFFFLKKPLRAAGNIGAVRPQPNSLDYLSNATLRDQLSGFDCGGIFKMFAVTNGVNTSGFGLDLASLGQLAQAGEARFVSHIILAVQHSLDTNRGPFAVNRGADNQL